MSEKELNHIPDSVECIHLIAVCGTGMGALAGMLKDLGYTVTGSDQNVYPPMSDFLAAKGITVSTGFKGANLDHRPDLVVVGNAVSRDNPEVVHMLREELPYCSMPQAINHFVAAGKKPIVVTGTHGKTTTASIIAWILEAAGLNPTFLIGGILKNFDGNYRLGKGDVFVVEGDEYDTAYFDKGPKFLHYRPHLAIMTSVEFDHADIFDDLDHVKRVFSDFAKAMPQDSTLITFDDDPNIDSLLSQPVCRLERYGERSESYWQLKTAVVKPPSTYFDVYKQGVNLGTFESALMGDHNRLDILAAIAVADHLGISTEDVAEALSSFKGIKRRQEVRGRKRGVTVMDDFAHHPTAVRETIRAVRPFYREGRVVAVFEPRTNSSMRDVFQGDYAQSFDQADLICIAKPPLLNKIPEGHRFSSEKLVADLRKQGKTAHYFPDTDAILEFLTKEVQAGDLVLIMSNGGFDNIHQRLLDQL